MARFEVGRQFGEDLVKALGMEGKGVRDIVIVAPFDGAVEVHVSMYHVGDVGSLEWRKYVEGLRVVKHGPDRRLVFLNQIWRKFKRRIKKWATTSRARSTGARRR